VKSEDIKRERRTQYNPNPSPRYIEAVQALEELDDLEDPYAGVMSVKRNPGGKFPNGAQLGKLLHKRRVRIPGRKDEVDADDVGNILGIFDHSTTHKHPDGEYVITTEPYGTSFEDLCEIVDFCRYHKLRVDIDSDSAWHPGRTIRATIRCAKDKKGKISND
jgi:hypothetical protein